MACFSCLSFQLQHVNINYRKVRVKNIPVNQGVINIYMVVKAIGMFRSSMEMVVSEEKRVAESARAVSTPWYQSITDLIWCMGKEPGPQASLVPTGSPLSMWWILGQMWLWEPGARPQPILQVTHIIEAGALRLRYSLSFVLMKFSFPSKAQFIFILSFLIAIFPS